MSLTPVLLFPTTGPVGLGGSTPSILLSQGAGILSAKAAAGTGSAEIRLLRWNIGVSGWDYVTMNGQRDGVTPDSKTAGGVATADFPVPVDSYYAAYVTTQPPSNNIANLTVDISGQAAPGAGLALMTVGPVAAANATAVHGSINATGSNTIAGPYTNPVTPRNLRIVTASSWDGGDITVSGTNQFDEVISETFTLSPAGTVDGVKIFKTVSGATKTAVGTGGTATIGTGIKIGLPKHVAATSGLLVTAGTSIIAATLDTTYSAFAVDPGTPPSATTYTVIAQTTG